jgi:uncharacterized protein (TIGR02996 family)
MYPEAEALLDAIFDHPADDTPRLVYADWLQEHGQESCARFIRLQCAAAREKLGSDEANRLWEEIGRVWNRLAEEWWLTRGDWLVHGWNQVSLDAVHFDRGFLRPSVSLPDDQFLYYLRDEACWPLVALPGCSLLLTSAPVWDALASLRQLRRLEHLRVSVAVHDEVERRNEVPHAIADFLSSPDLCNLKVLDLSEVRLTRAVADVLLSAPTLASVEQLHVLEPSRRNHDMVDALRRLEGRFQHVFRYG